MNADFDDLLERAKERLTIPALWELLQLPGHPPPRGTGACRSPFREERHPSFSIFANGTAFKDFGSGEQGDAVEFLRLATGLEGRALFDRFRELAGLGTGAVFVNPLLAPRRKAAPEPEPEKLADRSTMRIPSLLEMRLIAGTRRLSMAGLGLAVKRGFLRSGMVRGQRCWIVCEPDGRVAAARRLDGELFARPDGSGYKSHALTGKKLPLGLSALPAQPPPDSAVLLVEGEPDFLAAFHFIAQWGEPNLFPVSFLGRTTELHPEAARRLSGWRILSFPHADEDGGGVAAMRRWADAVPGGGRIDSFVFDGLRKSDGSPLKDLNDAADIHPEEAEELAEMNPLPPRHVSDPVRYAFDFQNDMRAAFWGRIAGTTGEGFPVLDDGSVIPF